MPARLPGRSLGRGLVALTLAVGCVAAVLNGPGDSERAGSASVLAGGPGEGGAEAPAEAEVWVQPQPVEAADQGAVADALAGVRPGPVPRALSGQFVVAAGSESPPTAAAAVRTVRVEVEAGLPVDVEAFAAFVMQTLNDPRGWGADGSVSFARTDGAADIRVLVASASTVDRLCAPLATNGKWSCGRYGHAALNADRWVGGAPAFLESGAADLTQYRQYLVNHEVGHLLGRQHTGCPAAGAVAPVMLQQSLGLDGCLPNGWPNP